ncbi:UNKNOWN [Stylonychia lemnae]|uniref:Uncharacterized protein n=1 Tax=Stylonychia lemnae TaxID=5949 RepID=A0A078AKG1_STYLE|nr:UNKNOWN [Stylonychia lemnae]|eukprot:CDW82704.1 UNKNOWN [Stylonychia lemnae]
MSTKGIITGILMHQKTQVSNSNLHKNTTVIAPFYRPGSTVSPDQRQTTLMSQQNANQITPYTQSLMNTNTKTVKFSKNSDSKRPFSQVQVSHRYTNSHHDNYFNRQKHLIKDEVVTTIMNSLLNKNPKINQDFLQKLCRREVDQAYDRQQVLNGKGIVDLEARILSIITSEVNVIKQNSIEVDQHNHYLKNTKAFGGGSQSEKKSLTGRGILRSNQSQDAGPFSQRGLFQTQNQKNTLSTTYKEGFQGLDDPGQSYREATPKQTSLHFADFSIHQNLKGAILEQHRQQMKGFYGYQMNQQLRKLQDDQSDDKKFAEFKKFEGSMQSKQEKLQALKKRRQMIQSAQGLRRQHQDHMRSLQKDRNSENQEDQQLIARNIRDLFDERIQQMHQRGEKVSNQEYIKHQMLLSQHKLSSERMNELNHDQNFIKSIGFAKTNKPKANLEAQGTIFDQFYNRQPHKAFELARKQELKSKEMIQNLENKQNQKLEQETKRLDLQEQEVKIKGMVKDFQERTMRHQINKDIQWNQRSQMRDQISKLQKELVENDKYQKQHEKEDKDYELQQWNIQQERRKQMIENQQSVKKLAEQQNKRRFLESLQ